MRVKEVMSSTAITIDEDENLKAAARKMRDLDIGCLPVCQANGDLAGIITDRDITCRGVADGLDTDAMIVSDVMSKDLIWCNINEDIEDAIRLMENQQIRRLPVLDVDKKLVGILALGDISTHLPHDLSGEVIEAVSMPVNRACPVAAS
ncbi:MAG: inosine-5-monophosphate dehydrogenase [Alphaproteobacteria bacterium]|nr:MAG: inosine-5-monophosphate dehydrogenase [Alphaproteobacteria bacterium]